MPPGGSRRPADELKAQGRSARRGRAMGGSAVFKRGDRRRRGFVDRRHSATEAAVHLFVCPSSSYVEDRNIRISATKLRLICPAFADRSSREHANFESIPVIP